ncbi:MAG: hypothetical protein ACM3U1_05195 [Chloroflexota bacterium]
MAENKSLEKADRKSINEREEKMMRTMMTKEIMSKIEKRLLDNDPDVMKALKIIIDDNYRKKE